MKFNLTYEILGWADAGGTEGDRPSTLKDVDDPVLQAKIEKMMDRGLVTPGIVQEPTQDCSYDRYLDLHLTAAGHKVHLQLREESRDARASNHCL